MHLTTANIKKKKGFRNFFVLAGENGPPKGLENVGLDKCPRVPRKQGEEAKQAVVVKYLGDAAADTKKQKLLAKMPSQRELSDADYRFRAALLLSEEEAPRAMRDVAKAVEVLLASCT